MGKTIRWGDPLDGPVGLRWGTQNVLNLMDDQQYIIDQLGQIDESLGGKKSYYSSTGDVPKALPNGKCDPDLVEAILDFQRFWISQGKLKVADGVIDRRGPSLRLMDQAVLGMAFAPDPLKSISPEGQVDPTACWAACYAWWLRAAPEQWPMTQLNVLAAGSGSGIVTPNGTVDVNKFMTFLSGRHLGLRSSRIAPAEFKPLLAASRLPSFPIIIAFASSIMGGHANVIHAYDEKTNTVSVMECWFPDPSADPNYTFSNAGGLPIFSRNGDGAPFKFKGAHQTRNLDYYSTRPLGGLLLIFPDPR